MFRASSAQVAESAIKSAGRSLQKRLSAGSMGFSRSSPSPAFEAAGVKWARAMSAIIWWPSQPHPKAEPVENGNTARKKRTGRMTRLFQMTPQCPGVGVRILALELFPVVGHIDQLAGEMVRPLGRQEKGDPDLFIGVNAPGQPDLLRVFAFARSRTLVRLENFVGHAGVGAAG